MIIKIIVFFHLFALIKFHRVKGFSPRDFCVLPEEYQKEARCKQFQCGTEFCSTTENKCKSFIGWTILLGQNVSYVKKTADLYPYFLLSIKVCVSSQYILLKSEVCENKKLCYERKQWSSRLMFRGPTVKVEKKCPCKSKYEYDCENGYCAVNKNACKIMLEDKKYKKIVKETKVCQ